nr:MAG TPA: GMPK protein [Caudoviricetes sp.]
MLIVLVGKSASGKTTLEKYISENFRYEKIVSHTTRPIRGDEVDGMDYHYVSEDVFNEMRLNNELVEHATFNNWSYGISKKEIEDKKDAIVVVNPAGLRRLRKLNIPMSVFYVVCDDKTRYKRSIDRGDDIVEIALRSRSDTDCFNGIEDEVDRILLGTNTVEGNTVEVFEVVARKNRE